MSAEPRNFEVDPQVLKSIPPAQFGAAASKLVAASIGDITVVFSRSPIHTHFSLADIEWMILPAVFSRQFYVAEVENKKTGFRAPIAVATWAFVSEEVDRRLQSEFSRGVRLRPDEWKSGDIGWIIDLAGDPRGIAGAVEWLKAGPFRDCAAKIVLRDESGSNRVATIDALTTSVDAREASL